jgi:hypothetical protein
LEALQARTSASTQSAIIDAEFFDTAEGIDLPGADLSYEELTIQVVPEQVDEFTCGSCFRVRHRSPLTRRSGKAGCCTDCES